MNCRAVVPEFNIKHMEVDVESAVNLNSFFKDHHSESRIKHIKTIFKVIIGLARDASK
jgi:hypothetical protein